VLAFPSQFAEPFGISQVEAMAAGLVVVTSGTGGAAEVVRDGRDGLVFDAHDCDALAAKLRMLAGDPAAFRRLQADSQRRAFSFSVDSSVRMIERLSEELLGALEDAREPAPLPFSDPNFEMSGQAEQESDLIA
jgi:glycosyltransferase involved in cell wall biosynthesis